MFTQCVYLGEDTGHKDKERPVHACQLHENCILSGSSSKAAGCGQCTDKLILDDPKFADKWIDPLLIMDRRSTRTPVLRDLLAGGKAFLIGGGPSVNELNLSLLGRRGVWSLAINNVAGHSKFQVQAFVCSDPPSKFSSSIWLDPKIIKFVPTPKLRGGRSKLRRRFEAWLAWRQLGQQILRFHLLARLQSLPRLPVG